MAGNQACAELVAKTGVPDDACLRAAAEHVAHEMRLLQLAWDSRQLHVSWTLWFITARSLMDFFFTYERKRNAKGEYLDDILASDFQSRESWQKTAYSLETEQPPDYKLCREIANKLSAHLTYSRIDKTSAGPLPPSQPVHEYLLGVASVWLDGLAPARRTWFGRGVP